MQRPLQFSRSQSKTTQKKPATNPQASDRDRASGAAGGGYGAAAGEKVPGPEAEVVEAMKVTPLVHLKTLTKGKLWTVQDFDFLTVIGHGTFSKIQLITIKGDKTPMVLKRLNKVDVVKMKQVVHTMSEKTIYGVTSHPFIVNCLTTFQCDRRLYFLLEYVNGGDLFGHLRNQGRLPNDHARFYSGELVLALSYVHTLNIIYRDVKPENCLLDGYGHLKLADFGFAKVIDGDSLTHTICGTPEYIAPEIIRGEGHDKTVDMWSLGVLLYEMISGTPPFIGDSPYSTYEKVLAGKFDFARHFDVKLKDLIRNLLVESPKQRIGGTKKGLDEVKRHKWFKRLDWDLLLNRSLPPPFVPPVTSADDTSMFETYPESTELPGAVHTRDKDVFEGFSAEIN